MTLDLIHSLLQLTHVLLLRMKLIGKENQAHCMKFKTFEFFLFLISIFLEKTLCLGKSKEIVFKIRIRTLSGDVL